MAGSFNRVILMGRLTRDVDFKTTSGGLDIANFTLAVDDSYVKKDSGKESNTLFIDCSAFSKTAETIGRHFRKGSHILVDGRLKLDQWETKEGVKRQKISAVVDRFSFTGERNDSPASVEQQSSRPGDLNPDDIPF